MILNCKEIREKAIDKIKQEGNIENCKAVFVQVGEDQASNVYVRNKIKLCEEVGINVEHMQFASNVEENELINFIKTMNMDEAIHGIMVQLPLPKHISEETIINTIDPKKDIDGFTHRNKGKLMVGDSSAMIPCTPLGIMDILDYTATDVEGKNVVIVGRSNIVGKPIAQLLINKGATVTVCNSKTNKHYLGELISRADVFISAIGQPNYFKKEFFDSVDIPTTRLKNIVAIDVGINRDSDNKLCGDIERELYDDFNIVTPTPNGVGVMTVLNVIKNIIQCYKNQI